MFTTLLLILLNVSGTLPVVYLNTVSGSDITDRENYVPATCYIVDTAGDTTALDTIEVRGRGNWTWNGFEKKPYKIKLASKTKVLGMAKSKHWALMAAADDNLGFLKNPVGYLLSKRIGLRWSPSYRPVELMLNGSYHGLYFLTENIRVESNRVNLTSQDDGCTAADSITGGWLVEIDNYSSPGQVTLQEGNGQWIRITPDTPEELSQQQYNYLSAQMSALNSAIYGSSTTLATMLDLRESARYYLVNELMLDCESYHGSCFLYKDNDTLGDSRWSFGPVWDFGNAYNRTFYGGNDAFIWDHPEFEQYWIGELRQRSAFKAVLAEEWYVFYHDIYPTIPAAIDSLAAAFSGATAMDAQRWTGHGNVCTYPNHAQVVTRLKQLFRQHVEWLHQQWGEGTPPTAVDEQAAPQPARKVLKNGRIYIYYHDELHLLY